MASCTNNKDLITKRHDAVVKKIAKELKTNRPEAKVWRERSWRHGTELLRPDITMIEGSHATIIEVTIPYETSEEYLEQRRLEKQIKYERLTTREALRQAECTDATIVPIVIGSLGTMTEDSNRYLRQLKLSTQRDALQVSVAQGTVNILNHHFRRQDFDK